MEKPATPDFPIHELMRRRWSPRAFADRAVPVETVRSLLEAARWAPSSMNEQPWRFVVGIAGEGDGHARLVEALSAGNKKWAPRAPVLIAVLARSTFQRNGKTNRHALYDAGQAVAHLSIQAIADGLFVHQMGGFDGDTLRRGFDIPDGYEPISIVAVGYPGEPEMLDEELAGRERAPRARAPQSELVFERTWARPW